MILCPIERAEASARTVMGARLSTPVPTPTGILRQSSHINWRTFWPEDSNKTPTIGSLSLRRLSRSAIFGSARPSPSQDVWRDRTRSDKNSEWRSRRTSQTCAHDLIGAFKTMSKIRRVLVSTKVSSPEPSRTPDLRSFPYDHRNWSRLCSASTGSRDPNLRHGLGAGGNKRPF